MGLIDRLPLNYQAIEKLGEARREIADLKAQAANLKAQLAPRSLSSDQVYKLFLFLKNRNISQSFVNVWHYVSVSDGADFARELAEVF